MPVMMNAAFDGAGFSVVEGHSNRRAYRLSGTFRGNFSWLVMFADRIADTLCASGGLCLCVS